VYIILNDTWKKATARGLDVPLPTSSSPSNPSSSPWCASSSPPHPSSTPTSGWTPPLPPAPYLSWRSQAADMRWGCLKTSLRVLRGGAPAPPPCGPPAPLPTGASAPATPASPGDPKVIANKPYNVKLFLFLFFLLQNLPNFFSSNYSSLPPPHRLPTPVSCALDWYSTTSMPRRDT
jgi:hypothetical protein